MLSSYFSIIFLLKSLKFSVIFLAPLEHPHQWMQNFCKFTHLKPTFFILHYHFYKTLILICLLYTSIYLNNHYYYYFIIYLFVKIYISHLKSLPLSHPKSPTHMALAISTIAATTISSSFALIPSQNHVVIIIFFFYKLPSKITQIIPKSKPQIQQNQTQVYKKDSSISNLIHPHNQ